MNKRFGIFLILGLLVLSISFSQASWFSDIWNTITGNTITGNAISDSPQDLLVPLYEYYSYTASNHFYHTILDVDKYQNMGYDYIGMEAMVFSYNAEGTIPLYRLYSSSQNDHFYTTSDIEKENAVKNYGYQYEEIAAYIYYSQESGTVPLYRLYSPSAQNHYYTTSIKERSRAINNYDYSDEVVVGYVYPGEVAEEYTNKIISIDYHHFNKYWGNESFLEQYNNPVVRAKVLAQLKQLKSDGFDRISTRIWFTHHTKINYNEDWRIIYHNNPKLAPVTTTHQLPLTQQEIINIKQYTQDVANENLSLAFTFLFVYCADYRVTFSDDLVGYAGCVDKITTNEFKEYFKDSVINLLDELVGIKRQDGVAVVEKIYLEGEVRTISGDYLSNGYRWLFKDSGLWKWFYDTVSSYGIEASTYFIITKQNGNELYDTLKWFKDNKLYVPDQIDISIYPVNFVSSDQYSVLINDLFNTIEKKIFLLFGEDKNYFLEETYYHQDSLGRFSLGKAFRNNFYRDNFVGVSFWQNSLDTTNYASIPPFDINILANPEDCFSRYYFGKNNSVGLSNGDRRFLCLEGTFYSCDRDETWMDFSTPMSDNEIIGTYQCIYVENGGSWTSCVVPTCTSFAYSQWTQCNSSALQSRTITSSSPSGCTGGNPESLTRQCSPPCLESNWQSSLFPSICPPTQQKTKTWTKFGTCNETIGITHPSSETISCTYIPPQCTEGDWSSSISPTLCPISEQQTKTWTKTSSCSGGINHPSSETISCTYSAPICTSFNYSEWTSCSESNTQSRIIWNYIPKNCQAGNPILSRNCTYGFPECNYTYSNWSECLPNGIQNRNLISSSPENCTNTSSILVQECDYVSPSAPGGSGGSGRSNRNRPATEEIKQEGLPENNNKNIELLNPIDMEEQKPSTFYILKSFLCRFLNLFREDRDC